MAQEGVDYAKTQCGGSSLLKYSQQNSDSTHSQRADPLFCLIGETVGAHLSGSGDKEASEIEQAIQHALDDGHTLGQDCIYIQVKEGKAYYYGLGDENVGESGEDQDQDQDQDENAGESGEKTFRFQILDLKNEEKKEEGGGHDEESGQSAALTVDEGEDEESGEFSDGPGPGPGEGDLRYALDAQMNAPEGTGQEWYEAVMGVPEADRKNKYFRLIDKEALDLGPRPEGSTVKCFKTRGREVTYPVVERVQRWGLIPKEAPDPSKKRREVTLETGKQWEAPNVENTEKSMSKMNQAEKDWEKERMARLRWSHRLKEEANGIVSHDGPVLQRIEEANVLMKMIAEDDGQVCAAYFL